MNKESYYFKKRASKQEAFCDRDVFLGSFPEMKYDTFILNLAFIFVNKKKIFLSKNMSLRIVFFFKLMSVFPVCIRKYKLDIISYFISKNDSNILPDNEQHFIIISYFISKNDSNFFIVQSYCFRIISYFISKNDSNKIRTSIKHTLIISYFISKNDSNL